MKLTILEPIFGSHEMSDALADMYRAVALKEPKRLEYPSDLQSITEMMLRESEAADILIFVGQMDGNGKAVAAAAQVFQTKLVRSKKATAHISQRCAELGLDPSDYSHCSVIPHGSMPVMGDGVIPACFCVSDERTVLLFDEYRDDKLLSRFGALCSTIIDESSDIAEPAPDPVSADTAERSFCYDIPTVKPAEAKRKATASRPNKKRRRSKRKLPKKGILVIVSAILIFALIFGIISSCAANRNDKDDVVVRVPNSSEYEEEEEEIEIILYEKTDDEEEQAEQEAPSSSEPESELPTSSAAPAASSQQSSAPPASSDPAPSSSSSPPASSTPESSPQPPSAPAEGQLQITTEPPPSMRQPAASSEPAQTPAAQQPDEQEHEIEIEVETVPYEEDEKQQEEEVDIEVETVPYQQDNDNDYEAARYTGRMPTADSDAFDERLSYTTGNGTKKMNAYDLVCQILQNETRGLFEHEALKAHAVATYSMIKYNNERGTAPSVLLKSDVSQAVEDAVEEVLGVAVYYNGEYANTVYHSTSCGYTTSSESVWGGSIPYLESVKSKWDDKSPYYLTSYISEPEKLAKSVKRVYGIELDGDPADWFEIEHDAPGGYVSTVTIDGHTTAPGGTMRGKKISGRSFRENLLSYSIRSHCFDLEYDEDEDQFRITTYGYGHGVGMSQYGAHFMAQKGYNFVEILQHYYPGTDVE